MANEYEGLKLEDGILDCNIEHINQNTFDEYLDITYIRINLKSWVKSITGNAFLKLKKLETISYVGSFEEFEKISILNPYKDYVLKLKFGHNKPVMLITTEGDSNIDINSKWKVLG